MQKFRITILFIMLILSIISYVILESARKALLIKPSAENKPHIEEAEKPSPETKNIGEEIVYDVKMGNIPLGRAKFTYISQKEIDGRKLNEMLFETKLASFSNKDRIFSEPGTLLPVRVERDIRNVLSHEEITEAYDQKNYTVTISKNKGSRVEQLILKNDRPIQNAVLLPHSIRQNNELKVGDEFTANLPQKRLIIKLSEIEEVSIPAGVFKAFHFESEPKEIDIWVSTDEHRIPIKIQGLGLFNYSLQMKEYRMQKDQAGKEGSFGINRRKEGLNNENALSAGRVEAQKVEF